MSPEDALRRQIEKYRGMSGEQRLGLALQLHEFACETAREGIRHQFPELSEMEVNEKLRDRIALSYRIQQRFARRPS